MRFRGKKEYSYFTEWSRSVDLSVLFGNLLIVSDDLLALCIIDDGKHKMSDDTCIIDDDECIMSDDIDIIGDGKHKMIDDTYIIDDGECKMIDDTRQTYIYS